MLDIQDIAVSYGAVEAVRGATLAARAGRVTCVMGRNGVGKTTLMGAVTGLLRPSGGTIQLDGKDITRTPPHRRARSGIGLVPQGRRIFPKLTVTENLQVGLQARHDGKRKIPDAIYDMFPVLKEMGRRRGGDLSGGQQQQLAIGRALVGEPRVLLLDEPTEGIQPNIIQDIGRVLRQLATERNMTIVLVEQFVGFVREFGDCFYIMNRGRVVAQGDTPELEGDMVEAHLSV